MLYIYYGTDEETSRLKAVALISALQKKAPDAELIRLTQDDVVKQSGVLHIEHYLESVGLFKQNYLLYLNGVDDVFLRFSSAQLERMKQSEHICIVHLGKLLAKDKRHVEPFANKMSEHILPKKTKSSFDIFSVANALKDRSKPKLWQALAEARLDGGSGEALVGMLFWAIKDMLTKRQLRNYTEQELKALLVILAALPHESRRRSVSIHNALERFALNSI